MMAKDIPFYVREFHAASMADAAHAADQALREDGVTVAVWRDRASMLDQDVIKVRRNFDEILREMRRDVFFETGIAVGGEARLTLDACQNIAKVRNSLVFDMIEMWQKIFFDKPYTKVNLQETGLMTKSDSEFIADKFQTAFGSLRFQVLVRDDEIHQDNFEDVKFNDGEDKLFFGGGVRMIENMMGAPTSFYADRAGNQSYSLPFESAAFFMPIQATYKAAWHAAGNVSNGPRLLYVLDLIL